MLQYSSSEHHQFQSLKGIASGNKVKKTRKCSTRSTRKHLRREFEKILTPAFACKLPKIKTEKTNSTKETFSVQAKKAIKILPDNLADFIIDNEASCQTISEDEYMKCMEILAITTNRKNQVLQICQLLGKC